jgi:hypothetical protein
MVSRGYYSHGQWSRSKSHPHVEAYHDYNNADNQDPEILVAEQKARTQKLST